MYILNIDAVQLLTPSNNKLVFKVINPTELRLYNLNCMLFLKCKLYNAYECRRKWGGIPRDKLSLPIMRSSFKFSKGSNKFGINSRWDCALRFRSPKFLYRRRISKLRAFANVLDGKLFNFVFPDNEIPKFKRLSLSI